MGFSVRVFCFTPTGQLKSVPIKLASQIHSHHNQPILPELAGKLVRFAEVIIELNKRKPVYVTRTSYYTIRFSEIGTPDLELLNKQTTAAIELSIGMYIEQNKQKDNIIDIRNQFILRGRQWSPSRTEEKQVENAALGKLKVSRLLSSK